MAIQGTEGNMVWLEQKGDAEVEWEEGRMGNGMRKGTEASRISIIKKLRSHISSLRTRNIIEVF